MVRAPPGAAYTRAAVPRFFVTADQVGGGRGAVTGADAAHLARTLRARPGERVVLVDDAGMEHGLLIDAVAPDRVAGGLEWTRPATGEPGLRVHVVQALPQAGMDDAVEAMTEVGAASIRPFVAERSVARPDRGRVASRVGRWRAVAREAAGLAMRGAVPAVHEPAGLDAVLAALPAGCAILACALDGALPLDAVPLGGRGDVAVVVGPEGGLAPAELALLGELGAVSVHLGARVVRSRLAGTVAVALLLARSGDLALPAAVSPGARP